jgi:alpha-beta hydrolase superfamily lysophospholipase
VNERSQGRIVEGEVNGTPIWFGPEGRPLFGWVHLPRDRRATRVAVLCPTIGVEAPCIYYSYRLLAERLAARGVASIRFDYDGTGDSAGSPEDPARLRSWSLSVEAALQIAKGLTEAPVCIVGIRLGALLASLAAERRNDIDSLVLWDPITTGKAFLREQQAMSLVAVGASAPPGIVDGPGVRFGAEAVADLSSCSMLSGHGRLAERLLVLNRSGEPQRRLASRLESSCVDWAVAVGQDALLDWKRSEPPEVTIDLIVRWLAAGDNEPCEVAEPPGRPVARMVTREGTPITETVVRFGAGHLFGIRTAPVDGVAEQPAVVFVNEMLTPHYGPARMWVDLARRLAAGGLRCLRFDLSGTGDSGVRPGQRNQVARAPQAFGDVIDAAGALSPEGPSNVVLVGLCAGAYQAAEVALGLRPRGICMINPDMAVAPPEGRESAWRPVRRASQRTRGWLSGPAGLVLDCLATCNRFETATQWEQALRTGRWAHAFAFRRPSWPPALWRAVTLLAIANSPARTLRRIDRLAINQLLVATEGDFDGVAFGSGADLRALRRSARYAEARVDGLDHAALAVDGRARLVDLLADYLLDTYAQPPTAWSGGPACSTAQPVGRALR